jgi:hypothetical protein
MKTILTIFSLVFSFYSFGQGNAWEWARLPGGNCIGIDSIGNTYVAGYFYTDSLAVGNFTLVKKDYYKELFFYKSDPEGNVIWAKSFGSRRGNDYIVGMVVEKNGNITLAGSFHGDTAYCGEIAVSNAPLNGEDGFVAQFGPDGTVRWVQRLRGGTWGERITGITQGPSGTVTAIGKFSDAVQLGSYFLQNLVGINTVVAQFKSDGSVIWASQLGGIDLYPDHSIAGNEAHTNVFISGRLRHNSSGPVQYYIAKCDSSGTVLWTRSGNGRRNQGGPVATDRYGNVFQAIIFNQDTIVVGDSTYRNAQIAYAVVIVKYNPEGTVLWSRMEKGMNGGFMNAHSLITGYDGSLYLAGSFSGDSALFGNTLLVNTQPYHYHMSIVKYNPEGQVEWAKGAESDTKAHPISIKIDNNSNLYMGGYFEGPSMTLGTHTLLKTSPEPYIGDYFTAKLNTSLLATTEPISPVRDLILIYPNPAGETLNIVGPVLAVSVTDPMGRTVGKMHESDLCKNQLNISSLTPGIYWVKIRTAEGMEIKKLVKN